VKAVTQGNPVHPGRPASLYPRRPKPRERASEVVTLSASCLISAAITVAGLSSSRLVVWVAGAVLFLLFSLMLAVVLRWTFWPGFDLGRCSTLIDEWRLDEAQDEVALGLAARSKEAREQAEILRLFVLAAQGDTAAFQRAHAALVARGFEGTNWLAFTAGVCAARRQDWSTAQERLERVSLPALTEQHVALTEALLSWAQNPDRAPSAPLKPLAICGHATLEELARAWPELAAYLQRRPDATTLN